MPLVCELTFGNAKVFVYDDAYRGITAEEMERRKQKVREVMGKIAAEPGAAERLAAYKAQEAANPPRDGNPIWYETVDGPPIRI